MVWKDLVGLGDSSVRVPESALVCKFCDTFVKPKGSRISEHLISARHNEMKKRATGKSVADINFLPNLQVTMVTFYPVSSGNQISIFVSISGNLSRSNEQNLYF